jgi:cobalt-zinc-cadmium efflux system outer membrane protein
MRHWRKQAMTACLALAVSGAEAAEPAVRLPVVRPIPATTHVRPASHSVQLQPIEDISATMSLLDFTQLAEANSPNLREAAFQVRTAQGRAVQAGLCPNPEFTYGNPQLNGSASQYNGVISQEFVTANKLGLSQAAALRGVEQAQLSYVRTRFDLLTAVRQRFYTAAVAQARVDILHELVGISLRSRDIGEKLVKAGEGTRTDAIVLDIDLDRAQVNYENSLALLEAAKGELAAVVGAGPIMIPRLAANCPRSSPKTCAKACSRKTPRRGLQRFKSNARGSNSPGPRSNQFRT